MAQQTIKILIPRKGLSQGHRNIQYETAGFQGEACKSVGEALQKAMGLTVLKEELTSEFYETQPVQNEFHSNGGSGS